MNGSQIPHPFANNQAARAFQTGEARAELFARKRDHNRAEAALLARYAAERIVNGGGGQ